jgi:chromosomal replication initiator protein
MRRPLAEKRARLRDLLRSHARTLTIEDIKKKVAAYYEIKLSDIHSARRLRLTTSCAR